jgi:hypothetical protein
MQTKKVVVASVFFILIITLGIIFRPISDLSGENSMRARGTIEKVLEAGNDNIVFKLKDDDRFYMIDEDLEKDLTFHELQEELSGKSVEIYYVKRWTPIDPLRVNHVTKVDLNKMTLYTSN